MFEIIIFGTVVIGFFAIKGKLSTKQPKGRHTKRYVKTEPARYPPEGKCAAPPIPRSRELSGKCYVIDGDTIIIQRTKIRLAGVDAPELDQPYGQKSKWAMVNICKGQVVTVKLNGETSYDRLVGTCYLSDGRDIGAELIKQGLAVDFGYFSGGKYRNLELKGARYRLRRYAT